MAKRKNGNGNGKRLATQQSVDQAVKSICDIMRRGNCAGAMQYVPELTWILFLRILDEKEHREEQEAEALGVHFRPSLETPFRWRDWAAPPESLPTGRINKRVELQNSPQNAFFNFVNTELLPHLRGLKNRPDASPRQKVISEIMTGVERVRIDTERNFLDVLDKVDQLTTEAVDPTHVFTLSQVYEGLLLKMGEKGNDGGQFFTPRQIIKVMVQVIDPKAGETAYDPGTGTGGFLVESFEHIMQKLGNDATADQLETLKQRTFWGREKSEQEAERGHPNSGRADEHHRSKGERTRRCAGNPPREQDLRMMVKQTHHRYAGPSPAPSPSGIRVRIGWCFC